MKTRIFACLFSLLILSVVIFSGCQNSGKGESVCFTATVQEVQEQSLLVIAEEGSTVRNSSDKFSVSLSGAELTDEDGSALQAVDFNIGDVVEITFDGVIRESYPAQISAQKVHRTVKFADCTPSIVNPMEEYSSPDFIEKAGFAIGNYPNREGLKAASFYLISDTIGQICYRGTVSDEITFRVAADNGEDVSGVYEDFKSSEAVIVASESDEITVTIKSSDYNVLATWQNYGYRFSVYLLNCGKAEALPIIEELASQVMIAVT